MTMNPFHHEELQRLAYLLDVPRDTGAVVIPLAGLLTLAGHPKGVEMVQDRLGGLYVGSLTEELLAAMEELEASGDELGYSLLQMQGVLAAIAACPDAPPSLAETAMWTASDAAAVPLDYQAALWLADARDRWGFTSDDMRLLPQVACPLGCTDLAQAIAPAPRRVEVLLKDPAMPTAAALNAQWALDGAPALAMDGGQPSPQLMDAVNTESIPRADLAGAKVQRQLRKDWRLLLSFEGPDPAVAVRLGFLPLRPLDGGLWSLDLCVLAPDRRRAILELPLEVELASGARVTLR